MRKIKRTQPTTTNSPQQLHTHNKPQQNFNKIINMKYNEYTQQLNLSVRGIDVNDIKYITNKDWSKLLGLDLHGNQIDQEGLKLLALGCWTCLKDFNLGRNRLNGAGIKNLQICVWPNLKKLSLYDNKIGNHGIKNLIKLDLPSLQSLSLSHTNLTTECIKYLNLNNFKRLTQLDLNYNLMSPCAIIELASIVPIWGNLQLIELECWGIGKFVGLIEEVFSEVLPQLCTLYMGQF